MAPFLPPQHTVLVLERRGGEDSLWGLPRGLGGRPTAKSFTIPTSLSEEVTGYIGADELRQFVDEINDIYLDSHVPTCPILLLNFILPLSSLFITASYHRSMNIRLKTTVSKWNKVFEKRGIWFHHQRRLIGENYRSFICFCKGPKARSLASLPQPSQSTLPSNRSNKDTRSTAFVSLSDLNAALPHTPPKPNPGAAPGASGRSPLRLSASAVVPADEAIPSSAL